MNFCENNTFFCIWIFYFKNKLNESRFWLRKKQFLGRKYRNCWPKLFFLWTIKTREILRKQHFFLNLNFLFLKLQWKLVLTTGFGYENSSFFCIWIFYFRKNKMKVDLGYGKSSFSRDKYWNCGSKIFWGGTIKTHEILRKQHFFLHMNFWFQKK